MDIATRRTKDVWSDDGASRESTQHYIHETQWTDGFTSSSWDESKAWKKERK